MTLMAIATLVNNSGIVLGYNLINTSSFISQRYTLDSIISMMAKGSIKIENLKFENGEFVGTNGSLSRLTRVNTANDTIYGSKTTIVILYKLIEKERTIGYIISDYKGEVITVGVDTAIKYAKSQGIFNGRLVTNNGNEYITPIKGKYNVINLRTVENKLEKLRIYENRQNVIGKAFEFEVNRNNGHITILKYYDMPGREIIEIPDFVDGFKDTISDIKQAPFFGCKYLKKIVMKANVKGELKYTFAGMQGEEIDLTDLDTSNIISMVGLFSMCNVNKIKLGNKFNTSKVINMDSMFYSCRAERINLGDNFDTSRVTTMSRMFMRSRTKELDLGKKFDTSRVIDMSVMFRGCGTVELNLGNKFDTTNVVNMSNMFSSCYNLQRLNLGNKFNTSNVTSMGYMFYRCNVKLLDLGDYFYTKKVDSMLSMFYSCGSEEIRIGNNFYIAEKTNIDDMFRGCTAGVLDFGDKFYAHSSRKLEVMLELCKAEYLKAGKFVTKSVQEMISYLIKRQNKQRIIRD